MTLQPRITLTEAITMLAFDNPVKAREISRAIADGLLGADRQEVLNRIAGAAREICDAGFAGEIECVGRKAYGLPGDAGRRTEPFVTLTRADYQGYPHYIAGYDALWKGGDETGETDEQGEFEIAFSGLASGECFADVVIVRDTFELSLQARSTNNPVSAAKRGRPAGSGGFALQDRIVVEKMREYITNQPGTTPHYAAGQFADQATGNASLECRQRRLARRYRNTYPQ